MARQARTRLCGPCVNAWIAADEPALALERFDGGKRRLVSVGASRIDVLCGATHLRLLGIGGAGGLVKFAPYRPYFVAATMGMLGAGFFLTYKTRKPVSAVVRQEPACVCASSRTSRVGAITLWLATALALGALAFPHLAVYLFE
jgi:mercuric ion transport protein